MAFSSPLVLVFSEVAAAQQPRYLGSASTLPRATGSMPPGHRTTSGASPAPMPRSSPWQPNSVVRSHTAPASPQRHRAAAELRRSRAASRTSAGASAPSAPSSPSAPGCRRPPPRRPKPHGHLHHRPWLHGAHFPAEPGRRLLAPGAGFARRGQEEAFPDEQSGGRMFEFMSRLLVGARSEGEVRRSPTSRRKRRDLL